jgi:FAD dependent oxidoreductase
MTRFETIAPPHASGTGEAVLNGMRIYDTVILGGGPAGTGSLVWAARHGLLGTWLDAGVAVVEQRCWLGGSLGRYAVNADTLGSTFLECLDGPHCEPLLAEVTADPVARELERWRSRLPTLGLVDRFEQRLGAAVLREFARHPNSHVFTGATALAMRLKPGGSVAVLIADQHGRRATIRAASAVVALGGRANTSWGTVEVAADLNLGRWREKVVSSHRLLTEGGAEEVARGLARTGRMPRAVILGGSHSAFSAAWILLERLPGVRFGLGGVQILYRSEPRVMYPSRAEALAESYGFTEADVCQATGRVHRVGGLRGDGREVWRRMHGKAGVAPDRRAIAGPIRDLSRAELIRLLDDADLIVSALGYRLATVPVFDAEGDAVPLARTGPAVGPCSRLLAADGAPIPGVFGVGLGSGFVPHGAMAGEASFAGQQNSLWLYQNGLGEMIYRRARNRAAAVCFANGRAGLTPRRCNGDDNGVNGVAGLSPAVQKYEIGMRDA